MQKFLLKNSWMLIVALLSVLTACNKDDNLTDTLSETQEVANLEYADQAVYRIQESSNTGKFGCYEFIFPITVSFADGTSLTANSYEELKEGVKEWKEANPDATDRPNLEFPIEVTSEDGEIITVNDQDALKELRLACKRDNFRKRGFKGCRGKGHKCFELVFPISISFPDGTTVQAIDRGGLRTAVREWKTNNPDVEGRPMLVFPIEVLLEDGTTQSIASIEELKALKDSCNEE
ncbi:MAG: hypothetical protein AAFV95_22865 [Bacteroidota bacterium]